MRAVIATSSVILILSCYLTQANGDCSQNQGFKQGAEQYIQADYQTRFRRRKTEVEYTKIEVKWQPTMAVQNPDCYDLTAAELQFKPVGSAAPYQMAKESPVTEGQYSKWTIPAKPCLQYQFQIMLTGNSVDSGDPVYLEVPTTVGPAPQEALLNSGYMPEAPTNFQSQVDVTSATLSFEPSDCAETFEIAYTDSSDEKWANAKDAIASKESPAVNVDSLEPCTTYKATIYSALGEEYSEEMLEGTFSTLPRRDTGDLLETKTEPGLNSVSVTWPAWEKMSCIKDYQVTVCSKEAECMETQTVSKVLSQVSVTQEGLQSCTDYTMDIKPIYAGADINPKQIEFRTSSPDASSIKVETVQAEIVTSGSMKVNWSPAHCATGYKVYQMIEKEGSTNDWTEVGLAGPEDTELIVMDITPCTKYTFAISAMLGEDAETEKTIGPQMISHMEEIDSYKAPSLDQHIGDTHLDLTWNHADCIRAYKVEACPTVDPENRCVKEHVVPDASVDKSIKHKVANLEPCTKYNLKIMPVINDQDEMLPAEEIPFMTTNGIPQKPTDFNVLMEGSVSKLTWTEPQCSTGFKVYQKKKTGDEQEGQEHEQEISENTAEFEGLKPCETHYYAVATVVGDQTSEKTEWQNVAIPPDHEQAPSVEVVATENGNITLKLQVPQDNTFCPVDEYKVTYTRDGGNNMEESKVSPKDAAEASTDVRIAANPNTEITATVKYRGDDNWSKVALYQPKAAPQVSEDSTPLIPIVVGVAILLVVVIVIAILVIRRKKSRGSGSGPDAEKNGGHHENGNNRKPNGNSHQVDVDETKNLKTDHENAENFS